MAVTQSHDQPARRNVVMKGHSNLEQALPKPRPRMHLPREKDFQQHIGMPPIQNDNPLSVREQCEYLSKVCNIVVPQVQMPVSEMTECEQTRLAILEVCQKVVDDSAARMDLPCNALKTSLHCVGSLRAGVALRGSDMDLFFKVTDSEGTNRVENLGLPHLLQKALLDKGYGAKLVDNGPVLVLKICSLPDCELLHALSQDWHKREKQRVHDTTFGTKPAWLRRPDSRLLKLFLVAIRDGHFNENDKLIISEFQNCVKNANGNTQDRDLCKARSELEKLPAILARYTDHETSGPSIHFPSSGIGVQCDINFSNELARHNTQLMRCYTRCDERLRHMIIFVKAWARNRDINSSYKGTLCSYGYVLMVIHFALNIVNPPLCPNLQHQISRLRRTKEYPNECDGWNIEFWCDERQIQVAAERGTITYNVQSIGSLLRGFFAYYSGGYRSWKAFNWRDDVISIRSTDGLLKKSMKNWTSARTELATQCASYRPISTVRHRFLLAIEDPFATDRNVARTVTRWGLGAIKDEFHRAHRLIQHAGLMGDMAIDLMEKGEPKYQVYPTLRAG